MQINERYKLPYISFLKSDNSDLCRKLRAQNLHLVIMT